MDHGAFSSFASSLGVGRPSVYITQLNENSPPYDANVPDPSGPIFFYIRNIGESKV